MSGSPTWTSDAIWIGGGSCSGKSTVADILGDRYSLQVVHLDDWLFDIVDEATRESMPAMYWYLMNDQCSWFSDSGEVPNRRYIDSLREEMQASLPRIAQVVDSPTIIEGNCFFPDMAEELSPNGNHLWVLSTDDFREDHYKKREWVKEILDKCADPASIWKNWMSRDNSQADFIRKTAADADLEVLDVDGSKTAEEIAELVAAKLGLVNE